MNAQAKKVRYYYWLTKEFIKKHVKLIVLSFFLTFVFIISFISLSPYLEGFLLTTNRSIGLVGTYDINSLPEEIILKMTNGLVFVNERGQTVPALASAWEILDKGKQYRVHLKDGLIWSDGSKFTAKDVHYNFKDVETKVVDDRTIYFNLKKPLPIFLAYLTKPIVRYPLVGVAGLYKVERYRSQFGTIKEVALSPNKNGLPNLTYRFYDNESTLVSAYKKGEITEFTTTKKNIADQFSRWKNTKISKTVDYTRLLTLFFNENKQLLKEKEIRKAIESAIDPEKLNGLGQRAVGPIPPVSWAFNPDLKNEVYDQESAAKTVKKSLTSSDSAKLQFVTYYDYLDSAEVISDLLKQVGFGVDIVVSSFNRQSDFDVLLAYWKVPVDPDQYYFWHSTQKQGNIGNYQNVKVDKLLEDGRDNISIEERKKIYFDFQKVILDDPPAVFLYYPYIYTITRK